MTAEYAPARKTNTLAIVSLIAGIVGFNIIAVVLGHIALGQIKRTGEEGRVLAIIGLVLGYIALVALVIVLIVVIGISIAAANS